MSFPVDAPPSPVSTMAAQEFDGMKEQLDLEQSLRVQAETFAHEVRNAVFLLARVASPGGHVTWECRGFFVKCGG